MRRHVVKLIYTDEWRRSLAESHQPGGATDAALAQHDEGVAIARRALAAYQPEIDRLAAACAEGDSGGGGLEGATVKWF